MNPLDEKFLLRLNLDPTKYKNKNYFLSVRVGTNQNDPNTYTGSIVTDNKPFVLHEITHAMFNNDMYDQTGGYAVIFRDTNVDYNTDFAMASLLFGSPHLRQHVLPLSVCNFYSKCSTLYIDVLNRADYTRLGDYYNLEFIFKGFEQWI